MSNSATVRSITVNPDKPFSFGIDSSLGDHTVPEGWYVVELKQCENCPGHFSRRKGTSIRFCGHCRSRMLMPVDNTDYKQQLQPDLDKIHRSAHLPRYDNSLLPKENKRAQPRKYTGNTSENRGRGKFAAWRAPLLAAFAAKGRLTAQEIQDITNINGAPWYAVSCIKACVGIKLKVVGSLPPTGFGGRPRRIYELETIQ